MLIFKQSSFSGIPLIYYKKEFIEDRAQRGCFESLEQLQPHLPLKEVLEQDNISAPGENLGQNPRSSNKLLFLCLWKHTVQSSLFELHP